MEALLAVIVVLVAAAIVSAPLRRSEVAVVETEQRSELEARKEAKYAEIRDAKLDHASGKLSDADFRRLDRELRAEAIEILKAIDSLDSAA